LKSLLTEFDALFHTVDAILLIASVSKAEINLSRIGTHQLVLLLSAKLHHPPYDINKEHVVNFLNDQAQ